MSVAIRVDFRVCRLPGRKSKYLCIYDNHRNEYRALARFLGESQSDEYYNTMKALEEAMRREKRGGR